MMKSKDFIAKLQDIVNNYKTVYMLGCFGHVVNENIIASKAKQLPNWYTAAKQAELRKLIGKGYFAFDCVNLIKGILWGWSGDPSSPYGGAKYASNDVPDTNADGMIKLCKDVSTDFSNIIPGEAVWQPGHIGVYIGNGMVIESTPSWQNKVQVTACLNIKNGVPGRRWDKHGKLPWVEYELQPAQKDWKDILRLVTDSPDKWLTAIDVAVNAAKADGNLGPLEIFKYLPELIMKVYNSPR